MSALSSPIRFIIEASSGIFFLLPLSIVVAPFPLLAEVRLADGRIAPVIVSLDEFIVTSTIKEQYENLATKVITGLLNGSQLLFVGLMARVGTHFFS
jgi:hypothetical protein